MSISHYTEATAKWTANEDLGIVIPNLSPPIITNPAKGAVITTTLTKTGFGYTLGNILCNAKGGRGNGVTVRVETTQAAGVLIRNQEMSFIPSGSANTKEDGVTGAIASTSRKGSGATFKLIAKNGIIQYAVVVASGSGYIPGESISISKDSIIADGSLGTKINKGVEIYVSDNDITASIGRVIALANGGSGYAVGDVLTLTESTTSTGTGTVTVTALDMGTPVIIQKKYPIGLYISSYAAGGDEGTGGTADLTLLNDKIVKFTNLIQGTTLPIAFKKINWANPARADKGYVDTAVLFYE